MKSRSKGTDSENYGEESMDIAPIEPISEGMIQYLTRQAIVLIIDLL